MVAKNPKVTRVALPYWVNLEISTAIPDSKERFQVQFHVYHGNCETPNNLEAMSQEDKDTIVDAAITKVARITGTNKEAWVVRAPYAGLLVISKRT